MHFLALDLEYGLMQIWDGPVGLRDKKCIYRVAINFYTSLISRGTLQSANVYMSLNVNT